MNRGFVIGVNISGNSRYLCHDLDEGQINRCGCLWFSSALEYAKWFSTEEDALNFLLTRKNIIKNLLISESCTDIYIGFLEFHKHESLMDLFKI